MSHKTGYVFEELYMWHTSGTISFSKWTEHGESWENPDTKRRLHSLVAVSGLLDHLTHIRARHALKEDLLRFHEESYVDHVKCLSDGEGGNAGDECKFGKGGYEIATLSVGGVLAAIDSVISGTVRNAYCLVRPPGHHAVKNLGMGFCIFNNVALGAMYAREKYGIQKIAIVDYDVHHGNGTQEAFWEDKNTLFISLHQDSNYPVRSGGIESIGGEGAEYSNINIPLHPGCGRGAYSYAFEKVVIPALDNFKPDMILVSSGFDASFADPLGAMMLTSESYREFAKSLMEVAEKHCNGRLVFAHEGGYSKDYVPYCGLAVIETLSGHKTEVVDPYLHEAHQWGYHECLPHQAAVIDAVAVLHGLNSCKRKRVEAVILSEPTDLNENEFDIVKAMRYMLGTVDTSRRSAIIRKLAELEYADSTEHS